ncbi:hypothetical protein [Salegentibacter salinarum]|uniref:hypothetical protein n=1 Tax=Salegentibacter salinarum TaxID=447422 RepID=UPI0012FEE2FF|nr:hypothetical protein [Salegentibacter salinarum]
MITENRGEAQSVQTSISFKANLKYVDDDQELKEVADEVKKYSWKLEDLKWEKRKAKKV